MIKSIWFNTVKSSKQHIILPACWAKTAQSVWSALHLRHYPQTHCCILHPPPLHHLKWNLEDKRCTVSTDTQLKAFTQRHCTDCCMHRYGDYSEHNTLTRHITARFSMSRFSFLNQTNPGSFWLFDQKILQASMCTKDAEVNKHKCSERQWLSLAGESKSLYELISCRLIGLCMRWSWKLNWKFSVLSFSLVIEKQRFKNEMYDN